MATLSNRLQLLLDDERRERLERESERTGAPVSELIRRAIDVLYARRGSPAEVVAAEEATAGERYRTGVGELGHDEVQAAVAREAARTGLTEQEVIQRALAGVLLRPAPRPGIVEGDPVAERVDDLLDGFGQR